MDEQLIKQVVSNTQALKSMMNQRRSTIVRKYGEEHDADFIGDVATFYLPVDTDMEYISELKVKLVLGNIGSSGSNSGGSYDRGGWGVNTFPSYESWLAKYPVGSAIDADGLYGCQCVDYAKAFWMYQVNRSVLTGPAQSAYEIWTVNRATNAGSEFDLITSWSQIKKGDWIIWGGGDYGHVAMAAEDYPGIDSIHIYEQNGAGGTPMPKGGKTLSLGTKSSSGFLGAFRYKRWHN